jgi:membrane-bound lytic murein transglycosylase
MENYGGKFNLKFKGIFRKVCKIHSSKIPQFFGPIFSHKTAFKNANGNKIARRLKFGDSCTIHH